jgi:RND superfamily putative drug exporter
VRTGDARQAVLDGFRASSVVVTAAALIMTSVFVAFIPGGSATIKPIALGLAVGVFVDAFIVRMTLVPAVLVLLGKHAWWLPRALERRVPVVDVEGAALHRKIEFDRWQAEHGPTTVLGHDVLVRDRGEPVQVEALPGRVTRVRVPAGEDPEAVGHVLVGRAPAHGGELVVGGLLLPEQRQSVQRTAALIDLDHPADDRDGVRERIAARARVMSYSRRRREEFVADAMGLVDALNEAIAAANGGSTNGSVPAAVVEAALARGGGADVLVLGGAERLADPHDRLRAEALAEDLADALARRDATVIVLTTDTSHEEEPTHV